MIFILNTTKHQLTNRNHSIISKKHFHSKLEIAFEFISRRISVKALEISELVVVN